MTTDNFFDDYLRVIEDDDLGQTAVWLFDNAKRIDGSIFDSKNDWTRMDRIALLTLRAISPWEVFSANNQGIFKMQVEHIPELLKLYPLVFSDDYQFATGLFDDIRPQLVELMKMTYLKGIRSADTRVKNL